MQISTRKGVLGIAAAGFSLRLLLAARDVTILDRLFVPDDTYYTLGIARGLARGWGPSLDGLHLTNGFQPLLAFLLVPFFAVTRDPVTPLRAGWVLLALADAMSAILLARLAARALSSPQHAPTESRSAALWACAFWSFSPVAVANAMGGLETSLAVACQLACVEAWCLAREKRTSPAYFLAGAL
ncbi:MAG TPA: hypothetical protein VNO21_25690, partial [Polyangiaceae bacterium]|nr:hypothetical protein [Polyangiaceae bacterium]